MEDYQVWVVDGDPQLRETLGHNLGLDGYRVDTIGTGREVFRRLGVHRPDILLLGLGLPDMDGIQVCRSVRAASELPIILVSSRDGVGDRVLGLESGADDYLTKPFAYLELEARIRARLRRRIPPGDKGAASVRQVGAWRLVPERREVALPGKIVRLTQREYDLLSLLFRHVGRALDRRAIRTALWPDAQIYFWSRAIDVHIRHLRVKLEEVPSRPDYIVTVPGVGYLLQSPQGGAALASG